MVDQQIRLIESMIDRAANLLDELERIYERDLASQNVSDDALNLTHEVAEKCSNTLDQIMTLVFEREIKPLISKHPKRGGYFPAAADESSYRSSLGHWNAADLDVLSAITDQKLRSLQPFTKTENRIYARLKLIANRKHTGLSPQKRHEQQRVNVTSPSGGSVSWGPGVTFGAGVSIMGVPIDPRTQMPAHTNGINVAVEKWVSFHFDDNGEDALAFCRESVKATRCAFRVLLNQ
jgi:hypothetical protein